VEPTTEFGKKLFEIAHGDTLKFIDIFVIILMIIALCLNFTTLSSEFTDYVIKCIAIISMAECDIYGLIKLFRLNISFFNKLWNK
jgi:hypothetical protein